MMCNLLFLKVIIEYFHLISSKTFSFKTTGRISETKAKQMYF